MNAPLGLSPSPGAVRSAAPSLLGATGRLTLAASVLSQARAFEAACRAPSVAQAPAGSASCGLAFQLYEDGRWADAYRAAAVLADAGNPGAAKLVLLMLRHGAPLYGFESSAEPARVARWAKSVLQAQARSQQRSRREAPAAASQRGVRATSRRTASPSSITAIA